MELNLKSWTRGFFGVTGAALAGPTGALIGSLAGGLIAAIAPGASEFLGKVFSRIAADTLESTGKSILGRLDPDNKKRINHDLQTAFRDAFREAIYDLGGKHCFPQVWEKSRDVPEAVVFFSTPKGQRLWSEKDPLTEQVCLCFKEMLNGLAEQRLLPLDPPADEPAASVYSFLQAETPQALNEAFFTQVVLPFLSGFGTFRTELPNFETHLQHHLLDRTLIHLGENLKARTPAWRAYNRLMLEGMRDEIRSIDASQKEILDRLDALLGQPETAALTQWTDSLADLLSATGRIEKQLTEGFEAVLERLGEQRQETLARFNLLLAASGRMEEKIDRVLRILEDGQYVVEGTPSVKLDALPEPGEPPFKGLQHFTEADAPLFFGREKLTAKLVGRLRGFPSSDPGGKAEASGFLTVVGASGSGKSSVVRAGLIPALRRGEPLADGDLPPQGSTRWPVHIITPTAHPLEALAASLTRDTESVTATSTLVEDMKKDPKSLHLYALKLLSQSGGKPKVRRTKGKGGKGAKGNGSRGDGEGGERLLLVVDQFEELFTLCHDEAERQLFIDNLLTSVGLCLPSPSEEAMAEQPAPGVGEGELSEPAASDALPGVNRPTRSSPPSAVVLVLTLRADFYAQCAKYDALRQAIAAHQEYIGPMTSEELHRAIEEPARRNGWEFERGLVGLILRDVGADGAHLPEPGALPLLSHALLETWKRRRGKTMILESYAESGGVRGAIAKTAETVFYRRLNANQQNIARNIFLRLTELGEGTQDTRRRAALSELVPGPENAAAVELVLKTLADARLITIDEGTAEVAHEALIREWPTLRQWLDEDREGLRLHHQLTEAARDWKRLGNDTGAVYRGVRLSQILEWAKEHDDQLSLLERDFIEFSKFVVDRDAALREEQRKRELEAAQRLAEEAEARRKAEADRARLAEETSTRLRNRNRIITIIGAVAIVAALLACSFGIATTYLGSKADRSAAEARQNLSTAEAASTQAVAQQATAVAEANTRATAEAGALQQKATAEAANAEAQRQSRISLARELAALSIGLSERDADLSLLLSIEAVNVSNSLGSSPVFEAQTSLFHALQASNYTKALYGHTAAVYLAVFSPDGKQILTTSQDGLAGLWDTDGNILAVFEGQPEKLMSAIFSPDGQRVLTASADGTAQLWDLDGTLVTTFQGHTGAVLWAAFSPDGQRVITASADQTAKLWKLDGTLVTTFAGHTGAVLGAGISQDGSQILTVSTDQTARLWDVNGALIVILTGHTGLVGSAAFSPDGTQILTASWDGTARLWKPDGTLLHTLIGHTGAVYTAVFSPDGTQILTSSDDSTARLWQSDGTPLTVFRGHSSPVGLAVFSPDGKQILTSSSDGTARLWLADGTSVAVLKGHMDTVNTALFNADGSQIVTASADGTARLWDVDKLYSPVLAVYNAPIMWAGFSPDGKQILTAALDNNARLLSSDGSLLTVLAGHLAGITGGDFSPDGQQVATSSRDGTARVWNLDGTLVAELKGHTAPVRSVDFSPDGKSIVTASEDGTARLWKPDGTFIRSFEGHTDKVWAASFNPDGSLIVTACNDGTARVWNVESGQVVATLSGHDGSVNSARFSPDGQVIVTAGLDGTARLWKPDGTLIVVLEGHARGLNWATFSPDGQLIATASNDGTARLWASDGTLLAVIEGHKNWVNSAEFNPDGSRLVTASWDSTVRIWSIFGTLDAMQAEAVRRVGRTLTTAECQSYLHQDVCPETP